MAANGGDLVSPNLFWSTSINYLRPNGVRFVSTFPFITLPANVAQSYGGGFLDQTYRTSSITASAPLLVGLAIAGTVATFRRGASAALRLFRIPLIGAAGITGGIMFYGYIAYRYTSEFMPFLIVAAAVGVTVATSRFAGPRRRTRRTYIALLAAGLAYGLAANSAFAIQQTYIANPGSMLRNYVVLQDKISNFTGNPLDAYVRQSDSLPPTGPADRLQIVGDCAALFVGTGEPWNPWVPVEIREVALTLDLVAPQPSRQQPAPEIPLATFTGMTDSTLFLQPLGGRRYSLGRRDPDGVAYTEALTAPADGPVSVNIRALTEKGVYVVEVSGRLWFEVAMSQRDTDWATFPVVIVPVIVPVVVPGVVPVVQDGWAVESVPTPPALSCTRLL